MGIFAVCYAIVYVKFFHVILLAANISFSTLVSGGAMLTWPRKRLRPSSHGRARYSKIW
jgi:hypothetical protein